MKKNLSILRETLDRLNVVDIKELPVTKRLPPVNGDCRPLKRTGK